MAKAIVAPDKFRGTATAKEVCSAMARVLTRAGFTVESFAMSDGGEGLLDAFDGSIRRTRVTRSDGVPIEATYKINGEVAVIEMANVAGLELVGGPRKNDPVTATTRGVGEMIKQAVFAGARRVIVGCGGSSTTDGGIGAIEALEPTARIKGIELVAAVDVDLLFADAAIEFAPQKGATKAQVALLTRRLKALEDQYLKRFGVDVSRIKGGGAAGGLAGGLAAIGAQVVPGFEIVAESIGLHEAMDGADLVLTGEGFVDHQTYSGKVVGQVTAIASDCGIPYLVIAGDCEMEVVNKREDREFIYSLVEHMGRQRAFDDTIESIENTLEIALKSHGIWRR